MSKNLDNISHGVTVLGSTGSIGISTLDVISRHSHQFHVVALTAHTQWQRMLQQCRDYNPELAVMLNNDAADQLQKAIHSEGLSVTVLAGTEGLEQAATHPRSRSVMAAIVGAAGLLPSLAAVKAGKRVLLANKEPLVMCGHIFIDEAIQSGALVLPIDSEHNAIFQCMPNGYQTGTPARGIKKILLTGSGGPFREKSKDELSSVTPAQACAHPNWVMGKKISVDSATMMNKGLELIEACWLFATTPESIQILVHPQSVIHSMVEYLDGSVLAQLGNPDMRTPIAHALAWPERIEAGVASLDLLSIGRLDFKEPDYKLFPCLHLARQAIDQGGTIPVVLNAANEVAVQSFLDGNILFTDIPVIIEKSLSDAKQQDANTIKSILNVDAKTRSFALEIVSSMAASSKRNAR
ncbi:MAG: 1-deoxy-D-xylulose-5-phosphate reductoisomerase [Gammaproteobacteria bacterium]|nr:MAG: 1-deoxy-D-xylulose-5-phosphate reductoisomerase [Gammaproteobacteria bacterium]